MLLYNRLCQIVKQNPTRFFMPGHKGGYNLDECFLKGIMPFDLTELSKTDNLFNPIGIISDAQKKAAELLEVNAVYYLTSGATVGLYASLCMCKRHGNKVLLDRGCHKSVLDALILLDLQPVFIRPQIIEEYQILENVFPCDVDEALINNSDICAVVITSPTYYGVISDIKEIYEITRKHKVKMIVDGAHGGNLIFMNKELCKAADFMVVSTHKTLPSLTGGGIMIVNDRQIKKNEILTSLSLFSTSSPSYLIMASVDYSIFYMKNEGEKRLLKLIELINSFKSDILKNTKFRFLQNKNIDPTRVVISTNNINLTGYQLYNILEERYNIICEMADEKNIVLIPSVCNDIIDFNKLKSALIDIDKTCNYTDEKENSRYNLFKMPKFFVNMRTAFFSEKKVIDTQYCLNEISAEIKCVFPPGIPFLLPGQKIDENIKSVLQNKKIQEIMVVKSD